MVQLCSLRELPLLDQPHGGGNVVVRGASHHAGSGIRAMNATGCLEHGTFHAKLNDHPIEITCADVSRTQIEIIKREIRARFAINCQRFTWNGLHEILQWRKCKFSRLSYQNW